MVNVSELFGQLYRSFVGPRGALENYNPGRRTFLAGAAATAAITPVAVQAADKCMVVCLEDIFGKNEDGIKSPPKDFGKARKQLDTKPTYDGAAIEYHEGFGRTIFNGGYNGPLVSLEIERFYEAKKGKLFNNQGECIGDTPKGSDHTLLFEVRIKRLPGESLEDFQAQLKQSFYLSRGDYSWEGALPDPEVFDKSFLRNLGGLTGLAEAMSSPTTIIRTGGKGKLGLSSCHRGLPHNRYIRSPDDSLHVSDCATDVVYAGDVRSDIAYGWVLDRTIVKDKKAFDASGEVALYKTRNGGFFHFGIGRTLNHYRNNLPDAEEQRLIAASRKINPIATRTEVAAPASTPRQDAVARVKVKSPEKPVDLPTRNPQFHPKPGSPEAVHEASARRFAELRRQRVTEIVHGPSPQRSAREWASDQLQNGYYRLRYGMNYAYKTGPIQTGLLLDELDNPVIGYLDLGR